MATRIIPRYLASIIPCIHIFTMITKRIGNSARNFRSTKNAFVDLRRNNVSKKVQVSGNWRRISTTYKGVHALGLGHNIPILYET